MKKLCKKRSVQAAVETLENRCFLSATVLSQIPTQSVTVGQSPTQVTLSGFLNDPELTGGTVIKMNTPEGIMFLQLTDSTTPNTVANFVTYINNGEYVPTIIQRSVPGFVLQGGGTKPDGSNNNPVQSLQGEPGLHNLTGTIAMALSSGPNSGTNQWFINLADNSSLLDGTVDGGPFTVFGNVIDGTLSVANTIAQLPVINGSAENFNWGSLPVVNYSGSSTPGSVPEQNLVTDTISVVPSSQAVPMYSASSDNTNLVTTSINNGVLTLTPAANATSGSTTTVTAAVTDLAGNVVTSTFTVTVVVPGPKPSTLAFIQPPVNTKAGHAIAPSITVRVEDGSGNPITGTKVNLVISSGPTGGTLIGTLHATSQNGVATFSNVTIDEAGSYTLVAKHGATLSAASRTFAIRHIAASQLAFAQEPTGAMVSAAIAPPILVNVEDKFGNVVTSNNSLVTLKIKKGTGPVGAFIGGTLTEGAAEGVATFSDININEIGTYKILATDGLFPKVKSTAFTIVASS